MVLQFILLDGFYRKCNVGKAVYDNVHNGCSVDVPSGFYSFRGLILTTRVEAFVHEIVKNDVFAPVEMFGDLSSSCVAKQFN